MVTGSEARKYHLPTDTFWEGRVEKIGQVAALTRYLVDRLARRETRDPTRGARLDAQPYFSSVLNR